MKITYITNVRMPTEKAHGIQMAKMCEAFANSGVEVELFVPWRFNAIKADPFEYYGLKRNFKISRIFSLDLVFVPVVGYRIQVISFIFFAAIRFIFWRRKNTLIYTREYILAFIFKVLRFRVVYECHRIILKKKIFFYLLRKIDKIVTNSVGVAKEFEDRGFKNVLACPNGVDLAEFSFNIPKDELKEMKNLPRDKKIIMYTGYLYQWKGIETLMKSAEILKDENKNEIIFVLVGGSSTDVEYYRKLVQQNGLSNVLLLGHKNKKDVDIIHERYRYSNAILRSF